MRRTNGRATLAQRLQHRSVQRSAGMQHNLVAQVITSFPGQLRGNRRYGVVRYRNQNGARSGKGRGYSCHWPAAISLFFKPANGKPSA